MIIAIDGPAGSGKSTIAREVAARMGFRYIDTGAMYRAITLLALERGCVDSLDRPDALKESGVLDRVDELRFENQSDDLTRVFVGDREVSDEIRGPLVTQHVSAVSADPEVREVLTTLQQAEAADGDVVLEGRDVGTVVLPDAELKIFLTASVEERARRRKAQLAEKGVDQSLEELIADIERRDSYDSGREVAPLRKAADAVEIDTSDMTIQQVIDAVCAEASRRRPRRAARWWLSRMVKSPLDTLLYRFLYVFVPFLWKLLFRMDIEGACHIPTSGPVVLASNHRSNLDPFFLGVSSPRQIHFMAKAELWKFSPLGWLITALGAFPITRGAADRVAVRNALYVLESKAVLGLFPEGHRRRDRKLGPISPGVTLFSLREGVTTIPVAMDGTERAVRGRLPRLPKVRVIYGPPIDIPPADMPRAERAKIVGDRLTEVLEDLTRVHEAAR